MRRLLLHACLPPPPLRLLPPSVWLVRKTGRPIIVFGARILMYFTFIVNLVACALITSAELYSGYCESWVQFVPDSMTKYYPPPGEALSRHGSPDASGSAARPAPAAASVTQSAHAVRSAFAGGDVGPLNVASRVRPSEQCTVPAPVDIYIAAIYYASAIITSTGFGDLHATNRVEMIIVTISSFVVRSSRGRAPPLP